LLRSEDRQLPHPAAVIGAAARLGRISDLGRATRAAVAAQMHRATADMVFVNVHARELFDDLLFSNECPLAPHASRVVLEISERAALDELRGTDERIHKLRKLGYRMAIDDLGAGYAGLSSFALIEPEVVKFDMSLIRGIDGSSVKRGLVRSMTALFKDMDILVVAEGVETERERTTLVALGCDYQQGFLFAKPAANFPVPRW
jgi:EAL domain-containing protein (putative c-di-GMP-specific phosphodiesterase class I)